MLMCYFWGMKVEEKGKDHMFSSGKIKTGEKLHAIRAHEFIGERPSFPVNSK